MAKKWYTPEQIINKLREAEILLSQGETVAVISKKIGVSAHTYYRWRKVYGGMRIDQARRKEYLKERVRVLHSAHYGGAEGTRTPDFLLAKEALSRLSYSPTRTKAL